MLNYQSLVAILNRMTFKDPGPQVTEKDTVSISITEYNELMEKAQAFDVLRELDIARSKNLEKIGLGVTADAFQHAESLSDPYIYKTLVHNARQQKQQQQKK